jgi:cobalt/nickel transport system ATP-binding protein
MEHVYPGGGRVDICGLEFLVKRGQRVAILGPNGSGKSTLLRHILGLLQPKTGAVRIFGKNPAEQYGEIRSRIGAVLQNVDEQLIGPTVVDDVAFAALNYGMSREETYARVEAILHELAIYHLRDRLPHFLSGGERKKVALAGVLVYDPELLILDEPLAGIDYASRREISRFLRELQRLRDITMNSTTHDMELVSELADVGYVMQMGGRLELYGTIKELFFEHDLSRYNLAPPPVVHLIKELRGRRIAVEPTFDVEDLGLQIVDLLCRHERG